MNLPETLVVGTFATLLTDGATALIDALVVDLVPVIFKVALAFAGTADCMIAKEPLLIADLMPLFLVVDCSAEATAADLEILLS